MKLRDLEPGQGGVRENRRGDGEQARAFRRRGRRDERALAQAREAPLSRPFR